MVQIMIKTAKSWFFLENLHQEPNQNYDLQLANEKSKIKEDEVKDLARATFTNFMFS